MSHAIDLALMGLAATSQRWQLVALAVLLIIVRRWTFICKGLLALPAGWPWYAEPWQPTPALIALFPGMAKIASVMSSEMSEETGSGPVRNQAEPAEPGAVRAHQHQVEPIEPGKNEPDPQGQNGPVLARSGDDPTIAYLAQLRKADGSYRFSANEILKLVGGTAADVKRQIASYRQDAPRVATSIRRPDGGW